MKKIIFLIIILPFSMLTYGQVFDPIQLQMERPADSDNLDYFGYAIDMQDDLAIVGAPGKSEEMGAVYIYERNTQTNQWEQQQQITAFDNLSSNKFGKSVSISNNFLFVGSNSGAYIYKLNESSNEWVLYNKLIPEHTSNVDTKVQVRGDFAVLNMSQYKVPGTLIYGYLYIYKYHQDADSWMPLDTITPEVVEHDARFARDFELTTEGGLAILSNYTVFDGPVWSNHCISYYKYNGEGFEQELFFYDDEYNLRINDNHIAAQADSLIAFTGRDIDEGIEKFYTMKKIDGTWELDILSPAPNADLRSVKSMVMSETYLIVHYNEGAMYENLYSDIYYYQNDHYEYMNTIIYSEGEDNHYNFGYGDGYAISGSNFLIGEPNGYANNQVLGSFYFYGANFPAIITSPSDQFNIQTGVDVNFSCNSLYVTDYYWQMSADGGETFEDLDENSPFSNVHTPTLTVNAQVYLNNAQFRCSLKNDFYESVYTNSALLTIAGVSVNEITNNELYIYPNPVSNVLKITGFGDICIYEITNFNGMLIAKGQLNKNDFIDVSFLSSGTYVIKTISDRDVKYTNFIKL